MTGDDDDGAVESEVDQLVPVELDEAEQNDGAACDGLDRGTSGTSSTILDAPALGVGSRALARLQCFLSASLMRVLLLLAQLPPCWL